MASQVLATENGVKRREESRLTPAYLGMPFMERGTYLRSRARGGVVVWVSLLKPWPEQTAWPPWELLINADAQVPTQPTTIKFKRLSLTDSVPDELSVLVPLLASFFTQFNLSGTTGILSPSAPKFVNGDPWVSGGLWRLNVYADSDMYGQFSGERTHSKVRT